MAKEKYTTQTIRQSTLRKLRRLKKLTGRSVPAQIEWMAAKDLAFHLAAARIDAVAAKAREQANGK